MDESAIHQPELIGREEELGALKSALDNAVAGNGSVIFLAGEAGIGKTRLVSELIGHAEAEGARVVRGWCLAESLEPLMPFKTALREAGLLHLVSGDPPPYVVSAYLLNEAGMLIAQAERGGTALDPDIFAGMLQAVGNFVKDTLKMLDGKSGARLNTLGYGEYTILLQTSGVLTLAAVIRGTKSEILIEDMDKALKRIGSSLDDWSGDTSSAREAQAEVSRFVDSGKYDGRYLVDDPKIMQENLFDNVLLGLQRASQETPVVLFLDDLQWADATTLNLVHYLARNTRRHGVLILGTYRPEDLLRAHDGRAHQLEATMQNMSREDLLERMEITRLGPGDTGRIIGSALGNVAFDDTFYDRIYTETGGTPFFVLELLKLLVEERTLGQDGGGTWALVTDTGKLNIPSKVHDVVKRRLDRLLGEQREILECASVMGEEFRWEVVGKVLDLDRMKLLKDLSAIEMSHRLVHPFQERYVFDHSKVREVLYGGIAGGLRREYHIMIADTLAELHDPDEVVNELAHHYREAGDPKAGPYLVKAGDIAAAKYANDEAVRYYGSALETVGDRETVLEKLADLRLLTGEYDGAIRNLLEAKEAARDEAAVARYLRKVGAAHERKGEYAKSLEVLAGSKEYAEPGTAEHGRILFAEGYAHYRKGEHDEAMPLFAEAMKIAREVGTDRKDIGDSLRAIGNVHASRGENDEALAYYGESLAVMEEIGDKTGIASALGNTGFVYHNLSELEKALEYFGRSLELRENIGDKMGIAWSLSNIGLVHQNLGDMDGALEHLEKSLEIQERIGDMHGTAQSLNNIGITHANKGDLDRALEFFTRALGTHEQTGNRAGMATCLNNIGGVHTGRGEFDEALECYRRSLEIEERIGNKMGAFHTLCGMAEARLDTGDLPAALELATRAVDIAVGIGARSEEAIGRRHLGKIHRELNDHQTAETELDTAKAIMEEVGRKEGLTKVLYEYALLFKATAQKARAAGHKEKAKGDREQARDLLTAALAEFESMGMNKWVERCREALEGL